MDIFLAALIAFLTLFVPGILSALALLKGTKLHMFEVIVIGFIFGMIFPATLTWMESYLMDYIHFFAFSLELFELNAAIISVIAFAICLKEGVFKNSAKFLKYWLGSSKVDAQKLIKTQTADLNAEEQAAQPNNLAGMHGHEAHGHEAHDYAKEAELTVQVEKQIQKEHGLEKPKASTHHPVKNWVWYTLFALMLLTFFTRMISYYITPKYFEFDPYFDMLDAERLLTFGYQPQYSHSAWPVLANGSTMRVEPMVLYIFAYFYSLANSFAHNAAFNTTLMSNVAGVYPPITAALLVFVIFMLLYREYDEYIGLVGASLAATMPVLFTTFISGEQLLEPWGIFSLFFFFAAYMLAVKNPKSKRYAIFAGIAFASTFLGAHYYTVDAGVLTLYILFQGLVSFTRGSLSKDFYIMNAIVLAVIAFFFSFMFSYEVALSSSLPKVFGIPITVSGPLLALVFIGIIDFVHKLLANAKAIKDSIASRLYIILAFAVIAIIAVAFTPIGRPVKSYINLSAKFTTPSSALFMTVQEFAPTGLAYNFGAAGFGFIAASIYGFPLLVWFVLIVGLSLLILSIFFRKSDTAIFYLWFILPLAIAGFLEVKYLPHFGAAYIVLIGVIMGELLILAKNNFKPIRHDADMRDELHEAYAKKPAFAYYLFSIALFFILPLLSFALLIYAAIKKISRNNMLVLLSLLVIIWVAAMLLVHLPFFGESSSIVGSIGALMISGNPNLCTILSNSNNLIGYTEFCNVVPDYWLNALQWIKQNVGPNGPRVSSWWDYGDWINWFAQTPAVIRGDNAVPTEDYATAANYVLGPKDNYTAAKMYSFMNSNQTAYLLFDNGLIPKWGALDFLACVHINQTSRAYALKQGQAYNVPYMLGTSQCELNHDPVYAFVPLAALAPSVVKPTINDYCSISNATHTYATTLLYLGNGFLNETVCTSLAANQSALQVYSQNGTKLNIVIPAVLMEPMGTVNVSGTIYLQYVAFYLPDANGTMSAPSEFYYSNFYNGYILGKLPGFTQVYPENATGINYVNGTYPIRIFKINNFTGQLPPKTSKPPYVINNYTFP